ncbi:MAG TPA: XdhC family protein [Anaerolineaceae bacterium]|nr:XdhC family protein [Anaerolineaceae bacterium]
MREVIPDVDKWLSEGKKVAIATVVKVYGSAPRRLGAKMAVNQDSLMSGSVSGGCVENAVIEEALDALQNRRSRLLSYGITTDQALNIGLACGGTIEVFVEVLEPSEYARLRDDILHHRLVLRFTALTGKECGRSFYVYRDGDHTPSFLPDEQRERLTAESLRSLTTSRQIIRLGDEEVDILCEVFAPADKMIIVGAVHIAIPLVTFARELGFRTIVLDPRRAFSNRERFPHADELVVEWPQEALEALGLDESTYLVVIAHDDKLDVPALAIGCRSNARYLGVLGSKKTFSNNVAGLRDEGITPEQIARIHSPIGLKIGASGAEEIALSIIAEVIAVRNGLDSK